MGRMGPSAPVLGMVWERQPRETPRSLPLRGLLACVHSLNCGFRSVPRPHLPLRTLASPQAGVRRSEGQTRTAQRSGAGPTTPEWRRSGARQHSRRARLVSGLGAGLVGSQGLETGDGGRAVRLGLWTQDSDPSTREILWPSSREQLPALGFVRSAGGSRGPGGCQDCPRPLRAVRQHSPSHPVCPQGLVGQDEWLREELLRLLASSDNEAMAARCALDLSLPEERLPAAVAAELRQLKLQER